MAAHELRHVAPFKLTDVNYPNSYGWINVVGMTPASHSLNNAENHMFLDILAELESRNYRLKTEGADARAGLIEYDADLNM